MKHGDTVDIETAHRIFDKICAKWASEARPVIWPQAKAEDAILEWRARGPDPESVLCRRRLLHLVCLDEKIKCLLSMPNRGITRSADYGFYVYDIHTPYDYREGDMLDIGAHFVILSPKDKVSEHLPHNKALIDSGEITAYRGIKKFSQTADEYEIRLFQLAHVLEYYAFSPCAVIKQRPRLIKAISPNPEPPPEARREWPAIQVVALRRVEIEGRRNGGGSQAGHKINIRFSVTEHMRRQPTRDGIKLIRIPEHWRGPKDGPIKPKIEKIYKVTR